MSFIRKIAAIGLGFLLVFPATASAGDFSFKFSWGKIPLCNTGNPNFVDNPVFTLSNVPAGTAKIVFKLTDLDVPGYNHGGGTVTYSGNNTIASGAFSYNSPCPPGGVHTYRWSATAKDKSGRSVGSATASRKYPE